MRIKFMEPTKWESAVRAEFSRMVRDFGVDHKRNVINVMVVNEPAYKSLEIMPDGVKGMRVEHIGGATDNLVNPDGSIDMMLNEWTNDCTCPACRADRSWDKIGDVVATFRHEMTHAIQMVQGRLEVRDGQTYWEGKPWPEARSHEEYERYPWEVEARATAEFYEAKRQEAA